MSQSFGLKVVRGSLELFRCRLAGWMGGVFLLLGVAGIARTLSAQTTASAGPFPVSSTTIHGQCGDSNQPIEHWSDFAQNQPGVFTIHNMIKNLSSGRVLRCAWVKGAIAETSVGSGLFWEQYNDYLWLPKADPSSPIQYGIGLLKSSPAVVYVSLPGTVSSQRFGPVVPPLTSVLRGRVVDGETVINVNLTVLTSLKDKTFSYEIQNLGDAITVRIQGMSAPLQTFSTKALAGWNLETNQIPLAAKTGRWNFSSDTSTGNGFSVKVLPLEILSAKGGQLIGGGSISLYLPQKL